METYGFLAETTFVIHWGFIATITLGPVMQLYNKWTRAIFWVLFAGGIFGNLYFEGCPLTILETALRESCGEYIEFSSGSFICHYLKEWFGFNIVPKAVDSLYFAVGFITAVTPQFRRLLKVRWSKLLLDTRKKLGLFPK